MYCQYPWKHLNVSFCLIEINSFFTDCFLRQSLLKLYLSAFWWRTQVPHFEWKIWIQLSTFDFPFRFLFTLGFRNVCKTLSFVRLSLNLWSISLLRNTRGILIHEEFFFFLLLLYINLNYYVFYFWSKEHLNLSKFQFNQ